MPDLDVIDVGSANKVQISTPDGQISAIRAIDTHKSAQTYQISSPVAMIA